MEDRVKNLENLCELITKEIVEQNKSMIEMNKNLINEIKCLRESFVKQDEYFEDFRNYLKKVYEINRQAPGNFFPPPPPTGMYPPPNIPPGAAGAFMNPPQSASTTPNPASAAAAAAAAAAAFPPYLNPFIIDQLNASMLNNLSIQSDKTPMSSNMALNFLNNLSNASNMSIPSSASALSQMKPPHPQQQQHQQQLHQTQPPPVHHAPPPPGPAQQPLLNELIQSGANKQPPFNPQQPPPTINFFQPPQQAKPPVGPITSASTPQSSQFSFKPQAAGPQQPSTDNKPPFFQLSPSKPLTDTTNKDALFNKPTLPAAQKPQPPQVAQPSVNNIFSVNNLFKPSPTKPGEAAAKPPTTGGLFSFGGAPGAQHPGQFSNLFKLPDTGKGTNQSSQPTQQPVQIQAPIVAGDDDQEQGGDNPEEYEPQIEYKPIVKLSEVQVKTGEEDEDVLFGMRCKLFRFDDETKEWKEKGIGTIKLLQHKQTKSIRVLMRRDQVLKLCANHKVNPDMKLKEMSPKQYSWMAVDFSENEPKNELLLVRFKEADEAAKFKAEFEKAVIFSKTLEKTGTTPSKPAAVQVQIKSDKPSLGEQFKSNNWSCGACYAPNKPNDNKCACCQTPRPGAPAPAPTPQPPTEKPAAQQTPFSFGSLAGGNKSSPFSFGQTQPASTTPAPKFDFGAKENIFKTATPPNKPDPNTPSNTPSIFGSASSTTSTLPSFASLAAKSGAGGAPLFGSANSTGSPQLKTGQTPQVKPLFGAPSTIQTPDDHEGGEGETNENPEEYEPQVEFKPLVKLNEVEVKTGEENEEAVFKQRCKLYRFDSDTKEWKEKGTGEIKVLKHKQNENVYRILMRRDQVLKLCANHRITPDLKLEIFNEKQVRWHAHDYSESDGKHETLAARFKHEDDAKKFKEEVEKAQKLTFSTDGGSSAPVKAAPKEPTKPSVCDGAKPNLNELFKKTNMWSCTGCYVQNKDEVNNCVACGEARKDKPVSTTGATPSTTQVAAPAKPSNFSFGLNTNQQTGAQQTATKPPVFGQSLFQPFLNHKPQEAEAKTTIENVFGSKPSVSFADLASKQQTVGFGGGFIKPSGGAMFGSPATNQTVKPLFGNASSSTPGGEDDEGNENQNPEEYEPQIDFKPLVKLNEVEVKTGEEDEDVMFKQRCKMYRFDTNTKEWKEKGVGDIKILKHKVKSNSYRILMRRDQVLKLCANHKITPDLKIESMNEKQLRWVANDCSEGHPNTEILAVKFRSEDDATKFKTTFQNAQNQNDHSAPQQQQAQKSETNNDIIVTETVNATKEQVEKARALKLPDNFYLYLNKPPCKGCRGCENCEGDK